MFPERTLGEVLDSYGGSVKTGPFGTVLKAAEYSEDGVPVVSVGEVGYGRLRVHDRTKRVGNEVTQRLSEYILKAGDIVFGRKGAVDRSAWVRPEESGWFLGSDGIRLRFGKSMDARFMGYQFQSTGARNWLLQHATGTTMASLNEPVLKSVPLHVPPLEEQRGIAATLGALDDKIDSNRRAVEWLRGLGSSLFERALNESFDVKLGDVAVHKPGKYLAKSDYESGSVVVYGSNSIMGAHSTALYEGPLMVMARIGSYCGALRWSESPAWVNNNASAILPREGRDPWILRWSLERHNMEPFKLGTGQPYIGVKALMDSEIEWPERVGTLAQLLRELSGREHRLEVESQKLEALRDALLPELLSGRIRVPEAAETVASA